MERRARASLPPLDPNGQPLSMVLRGAAASLGELRCTLATPDARRQLQLEVQAVAAARGGGDQFEDVDAEEPQTTVDAGVCNGDAAVTQPQAQSTSDDARDMESDTKKRSRADGEDDEDDEEEDAADSQEQLILYLPSVQCTCSSWNVKDATGDVLVTTLRVLFVAETEENDVAIDGCGIALHAVDSLPGEGDEGISHHVYCQIAEPMSDEGGLGMGMGCASAMGMAAQIAEENDAEANDETDDRYLESEESMGEDGTMEVYFKPSSSSEGESQSVRCQTIFDALTELASLNPVHDSDGGGGGLFSMLSMMAGMDASNDLSGGMMIAGQEDDGDDEMVVRLGGSNNNNLVENDDDDSSDGAPVEERQAMLQRLDDLLVVPPEYEIASEDGRFDDADDDDDGIL